MSWNKHEGIFFSLRTKANAASIKTWRDLSGYAIGAIDAWPVWFIAAALIRRAIREFGFKRFEVPNLEAFFAAEKEEDRELVNAVISGRTGMTRELYEHEPYDDAAPVRAYKAHRGIPTRFPTDRL